MSLGKNLKALRLAKGWDQKDLERISGVPFGSISAIEVRGSKRSEHAPALAKAFGMPLEALLSDDVSEWIKESQKDQKTIRDTVNLSSGVAVAPLLNRETAGMFKEYLSGELKPEVLHFYGGEQSQTVIAYRVDDDVMAPSVPNGCVAIVDISLEPTHGRLILINESGQSHIRKLVIDGPYKLVTSPSTQPRAMNGSIIGTVISLTISV